MMGGKINGHLIRKLCLRLLLSTCNELHSTLLKYRYSKYEKVFVSSNGFIICALFSKIRATTICLSFQPQETAKQLIKIKIIIAYFVRQRNFEKPLTYCVFNLINQFCQLYVVGSAIHSVICELRKLRSSFIRIENAGYYLDS